MCVLVFTVFLYCFYVYFFFLCFCLILQVKFFHCYVYAFLMLCTFCSVYSVFIVPAGTLRLPWLRFFRAFSSVVRSQRRGPSYTLPKLIVLFCLLFLCKCVLYYCHRESTQLKLTNISNCLIIKLYCGSYPGEKFTQMERVSEQGSAENILT